MIRPASQTIPIQKVTARIAVTAAPIHGLRMMDPGAERGRMFAMRRIGGFLAARAPLIRRAS
jgi:hypothetical protein